MLQCPGCLRHPRFWLCGVQVNCKKKGSGGDWTHPVWREILRAWSFHIVDGFHRRPQYSESHNDSFYPSRVTFMNLMKIQETTLQVMEPGYEEGVFAGEPGTFPATGFIHPPLV